MPDVYISDLPTGTASGTQYLAQDNGTTTSKVTVSDAVGASDLATLVGSTAMGTTATTVTGAIAEHEGDISTINSKLPTDQYTSMATLYDDALAKTIIVFRGNNALYMALTGASSGVNCSGIAVRQSSSLVSVFLMTSAGNKIYGIRLNGNNSIDVRYLYNGTSDL